MNPTGENSSKSNKRHERSRAYPSVGLEEALKRVENIKNNLGLNGQFNRDSIAVGMGYGSLNGASARAAAALVHYGLLDREKDQYSLSPLAKRYLLPVTDTDQDVAIKEAALSPALFADIFESFKGQVIPRQFQNRLIQEFGIQHKVASDVERVFKATMESANMIGDNGILASSLTGQFVAFHDNDEAPIVSSTATEQGQKQKVTTSDNSPAFLSVNLPSGLIVKYSQDLAPAFAFGIFGEKLKALDDAVSVHKKLSETSGSTKEDKNEES